MPCYDFSCKKCQTQYEEVVSYDESGKYPKVKCPACGSKSKTKLVTACNFQFAQPEGTSRWMSDSTGHDYRFHHNLPKVIEERKNAEIASAMGGTDQIYRPIDDLNNDSAWG